MLKETLKRLRLIEQHKETVCTADTVETKLLFNMVSAKIKDQYLLAIVSDISQTKRTV